MSIEQRIKKIEEATKPEEKMCLGIVTIKEGETNEEAIAREEKETGRKRCERVILLPDRPNI